MCWPLTLSNGLREVVLYCAVNVLVQERLKRYTLCSYATADAVNLKNEQITRLCEIRRGKTPGENGVPVCFYDMSGHPVYSELFPLLADQRALFLVVFSASDYVSSVLNASARYSALVFSACTCTVHHCTGALNCIIIIFIV